MTTKTQTDLSARPLLRRGAVAELLDVSERTVRQWTDDDRLPCVRLGRAVRYRPEDIERLRAEGLPS
jgi:excisionase family DNA binding protein